MIDAVSYNQYSSYGSSAAGTSGVETIDFGDSLASALAAESETESTEQTDNSIFRASELLPGGDRWVLHNLQTSFDYTGEDASVPEEVEFLPEALSTWQGGSFGMESLSTEGATQVGSSVDQFHNPSFVQKDGVTYAYYIDHSGESQFDVGLATSTDGVNFESQGKVLTKGDDFDAKMASFPSVAYDETSGQWTMLYEAESADGVNSICMATSSDGVEWTKQGPIIEPGDAGEASAVDVGTPTMFQEDGVWHVYFHTHAADGRTRIGYASGTDLNDLTVSQDPLLDVDAEGAEDQTVGKRSSVFKSGDYYYMFYETSENAYYSTDTAKWGINLARSSSPGGPWEKYDGGPVVQNSDYGFGYDGPEVALEGDQLYLYYRDQNNTTTRTAVNGFADVSMA